MFRKQLSLLPDAATYGASSLVGQVLNFLLVPLYTQCLDTAQYAISGMLAIVTLLFAPLANLGMTNAIFRRYKDLNDITYQSFKAIGRQIGFHVAFFSTYSTSIGKVLKRVPGVRSSIVMDIFSTGASAVLRKGQAAPAARPDKMGGI